MAAMSCMSSCVKKRSSKRAGSGALRCRIAQKARCPPWGPWLTAACVPAPSATARSGSTLQRGSRLNSSRSRRCTSGVRDEPPTRINSSSYTRLAAPGRCLLPRAPVPARRWRCRRPCWSSLGRCRSPASRPSWLASDLTGPWYGHFSPSRSTRHSFLGRPQHHVAKQISGPVLLGHVPLPHRSILRDVDRPHPFRIERLVKHVDPPKPRLLHPPPSPREHKLEPLPRIGQRRRGRGRDSRPRGPRAPR